MHTSRTLFLFLSFLLSTWLSAQDTFSIVAVDPETGEVGSAGATCLDSVLEGTSAIIISYVKPGKGAIHTQSFWNPVNQANATARMEAGDSPDEIIAWLGSNDAEGNPAVRQYGVADFDAIGNPRVAAFTGAGCFDWKGHQFGPNYAVQGNILSGESILDSMSFRFFFEDGDLANKLMAAMQGAKKIGADSRCFSAGVSSRSAFIRVAKPTDTAVFYLDLVVGSTPFGVDPIDVLQQKFDVWRENNPIEVPNGILDIEKDRLLSVRPNPAGPGALLHVNSNSTASFQSPEIIILDLMGRLLERIPYQQVDIVLGTLNLPSGHLVARIMDGNKFLGQILFEYNP